MAKLLVIEPAIATDQNAPIEHRGRYQAPASPQPRKPEFQVTVEASEGGGFLWLDKQQ